MIGVSRGTFEVTEVEEIKEKDEYFEETKFDIY